MQPHLAELTEAIYDAAVAPAEWARVMRLMKQRFATGAETFYGLDLGQRKLKTLHIEGVAEGYVRSFTELFYTDDNPCIRSEPLHRPGVVRTDQRLLAYFRDPGVLRRSQYYNEWMRPQSHDHSMGITLHADRNTTLNLSLFRPAGVGPYGSDEIADFSTLCEHLRRSFRLASRLGTLDSLQRVSIELLEANAAGILLLDGGGRIVYGNAAAFALAAAADGLAIAADGIRLKRHSDNDKLGQMIGRAAAGRAGGAMPALRPSGKRPYAIMVSPLSRSESAFASFGPAACVVIADPESEAFLPARRLGQLYGLTPAEAALAIRLAGGDDLREAAGTLGIRYSSARALLTVIFRKTETRRQGQLIKVLLSAAVLPRG